VQNITIFQHEVHVVYKNFPEIPVEVDTPMEDKLTKICESIQGFRANIVYLEARMFPGTPPEEREQRENIAMTTIERIRSLDGECENLYEESTQVWTQLLDN
jgi:hypothetical protein